VAAALLSGCGSGGKTAGPVQTVAAPRARLAPGPRARIVVIVMENREYGDVLGSADAPFITGLARRYALASQMYGVSHPSLPNYLALLGGSTFGIDSDCTDCHASGASLATQLAGAGRSWKGYMEDLPHPCFTGSGAAGYAKKHDPFAYFPAITSDPAQCRRIVPLTELAADERSGALPDFAWISPNLCHDMHDCSTRTGDRFLAALVPPLLRALGPRGLLFLTFDEGTSDDRCCGLAAGGHIVMVMAGGGARRGARLGTPVDHYSVLQTVEDLLGVARLRGAGCHCTPSLQPLLNGGR